jgi:hypothetical protein
MGMKASFYGFVVVTNHIHSMKPLAYFQLLSIVSKIIMSTFT